MGTIDFETWCEGCRADLELDDWSLELQYMIYECDALLGINGSWVVRELHCGNVLSVYQWAIEQAKHRDCELLVKYRHKLYQFCSNIIANYCLDQM